MFFTLSWVVLLSAIMILFSSHWVKVLKRITQPLPIRLLLPLLIFSWFVLAQARWIDWAFNWVLWLMNLVLIWLSQHCYVFPGQHGILITLLITCMSLVPMMFAKITAKPYRPFLPPYWSGVYIWIVLVILVALSYG